MLPNSNPDTSAHQTDSTVFGNWRLPGTILWGSAIMIAFFMLQMIAMLAVTIRSQSNLSDAEMLELLKSAESNGNALSIGTFVTTLICVPLIIGIAKLKRRSNIRDYFALKPVPFKILLRWVGILLIYIALSDFVLFLLGQPITPEFMHAIAQSAHPVWMLWLALVVAAPLFEELFFRGFLYKGLESSFMGPIGAIAITSVLWGIIHLQYDIYGITYVIFMGVILGLSRMRTGSLFVPLTLHAVANIGASVQMALLG